MTGCRWTRYSSGVANLVHEMAGGITGGEEAARAIMTTDTVPKQVALHHPGTGRSADGQGRRHAGAVAGHHAGVLTTDAVVEPTALSARCAAPPR